MLVIALCESMCVCVSVCVCVCVCVCVLGGQGLAGGKLLRPGSCCSDSRIPGTNGEQTDRQTGRQSEKRQVQTEVAERTGGDADRR